LLGVRSSESAFDAAQPRIVLRAALGLAHHHLHPGVLGVPLPHVFAPLVRIALTLNGRKFHFGVLAARRPIPHVAGRLPRCEPACPCLVGHRPVLLFHRPALLLQRASLPAVDKVLLALLLSLLMLLVLPVATHLVQSPKEAERGRRLLRWKRCGVHGR